MATEPTGMDAQTGRRLVGWPYVMQSIERVLSTRYFERVMRPYFGANARRLWGELANMRTAQRFRWAVSVAISLFVPNFELIRCDQVDLDRTGATAWVIDGFYLPRGHLGDRTRGTRKSLTLTFDGRNGPAVTG